MSIVLIEWPLKEEFEGIAVCSKSLSHLGDVSMRFIEWIELLRAQGVDKIFLKVYAVHPNVMKVKIWKSKDQMHITSFFPMF